MPDGIPILDTNVVLRHLLQDHPDHSPRASAFLKRIQQDALRVELPATALLEAVYTLESFYGLERSEINDLLAPLAHWRSIVMGNRTSVQRAFEIYLGNSRRSFADSYHAALAESNDPPHVIS